MKCPYCGVEMTRIEYPGKGALECQGTIKVTGNVTTIIQTCQFAIRTGINYRAPIPVIDPDENTNIVKLGVRLLQRSEEDDTDILSGEELAGEIHQSRT